MAMVVKAVSLFVVGILVGTGSGLGLGYAGLNPQVNDLQKQLETTKQSLADYKKNSIQPKHLWMIIRNL
jgi:uncharacterized membrane-anchored protein YhcB (DUF1043 family)